MAGMLRKHLLFDILGCACAAPLGLYQISTGVFGPAECSTGGHARPECKRDAAVAAVRKLGMAVAEAITRPITQSTSPGQIMPGLHQGQNP